MRLLMVMMLQMPSLILKFLNCGTTLGIHPENAIVLKTLELVYKLLILPND
jgi:hypothetical protein